MPNKMKAAGMPAKGKNVKKIGEHGVYGAESSIGRTMRRTNPVTSARQTDNLRPSSMSAISGSATVLTGKNRYSSVKGGMMGNKKSGR
jgi:hypothetical protein